MIDSPDEPNWSLLPHDLVRFFGLNAGFDRRQLKRSYNQLIRRFKPEKFPQEFQRIRAAFEQLDSGIRYGLQFNWPATEAEEYRWSDDSQQSTNSKGTAPKTPANTVVPVEPLHARIQRESVTKNYRELVSKSAKTAFDFYALAVMSDVVDRKDGLQFARWLLQGLESHKNENGLVRLLHAYCRGPIDDMACEKLLSLISQTVDEDTFFLMTEPVWRLLLKSQNFTRFRMALQQCESNLKSFSIDGRIAFYLQILKSAMWIADEEWIEDSINFIEQNFERIPPYLDFDVEIVMRLRAYIERRCTFVAGHALLHRLDEALFDYFSEDQLAGDQSVLACQVLVTQNTEELAAAFSDLGNPAYAAFYAIWNWVSYDVGERHAEGPDEDTNPSIWQSRVIPLLQQLNVQVNNSRLGLGWALAKIGYLLLLIVFYFGSICTCAIAVVVLTADIQGGVAIVLMIAVFAIAAGGYIGHRLAGWFRKKVWQPFDLRISARLYHRMWRRELINFLARSHLPYQTFRDMFGGHSTPGTHAGWMNYYIDQDIALPVYAIAQRFLV